MCLRAFPSFYHWSCLSAVLVVVLLTMILRGFRLVGYGAVLIGAFGVIAWGLGYLYSTARPDKRIAALAFSTAYLIPFTFAIALLSYVGTSFNLPLLDAKFARADAALGLHWLAVMAFVDAHPVFAKVLVFAYHSSMFQVVATLVLLATTHQLERIRDFLTLYSATALATIVISTICPAVGAFVFHNPPAEMRDMVGTTAGIWHVPHFEALRSGNMRAINPNMMEGLITFPSFHTALAVITAWALYRIRYLAWPALALNTLVIISTVPVGGHYFVDVFAGATVAAGCIAATTWRRDTAIATRTIMRSALARTSAVQGRKASTLAVQAPRHPQSPISEGQFY